MAAGSPSAGRARFASTDARPARAWRRAAGIGDREIVTIEGVSEQGGPGGQGAWRGGSTSRSAATVESGQIMSAMALLTEKPRPADAEHRMPPWRVTSAAANGYPHQPPVQRGPDGLGVTAMCCPACHQAANFDRGRVPGNPNWHLAPASSGATQRRALAGSASRSRPGAKWRASPSRSSSSTWRTTRSWAGRGTRRGPRAERRGPRRPWRSGESAGGLRRRLPHALANTTSGPGASP